MAKFEINLEGIGRVSVFKGKTRRLSFPIFRRKKIDDPNIGYIVMLPGDSRYFLKRSGTKGWSDKSDAGMAHSIFANNKWIPVATDSNMLRMMSAIDEFEKNHDESKQ